MISLEQIKSPEEDDCMLDIFVGGWEIPFCEKGHLSIWAISNDGKVRFVVIKLRILIKVLTFKLYYRENVSSKNLEGDKWREIELPNECRIFGGTCSNDGKAWFITSNGNVLVRLGIDRIIPYGKSWHQIQKPGNNIFLKQIALSNNSIWGLDIQGSVYFFQNILQSSSKWVEVPGNMISISISSLSQVIY